MVHVGLGEFGIEHGGLELVDDGLDGRILGEFAKAADLLRVGKHELHETLVELREGILGEALGAGTIVGVRLALHGEAGAEHLNAAKAEISAGGKSHEPLLAAFRIDIAKELEPFGKALAVGVVKVVEEIKGGDAAVEFFQAIEVHDRGVFQFVAEFLGGGLGLLG